MSSIVISGNTSGTCTLSAPDVAGSTTLTLPSTSGAVQVAGPAFSAYQSTLQSFANGIPTKIQFQTKEFDTNTNYDNATNYRFTPTVAGYYQVNGGIVWAGATSAYGQIVIYKNGSLYKSGLIGAGNIAGNSGNISALVFLNGSTDYVELYGNQGSGSSQNSSASSDKTYFQASFVRSA